MKKKIVIISSIFVLFVISASAFLFAVDKKPFEDLQASEVASASVLLLPPNESIEIDNIDTLVGMLNNIELLSRTIGHRWTILCLYDNKNRWKYTGNQCVWFICYHRWSWI